MPCRAFSPIPYYTQINKSNIHDAKILEDVINKANLYNINLVADNGYIKSSDYCYSIKNDYNIKLITPNRINSHKAPLDNINIELLNKRFIVEFFFNILKRTFQKFSKINDKNETFFMNNIYIVNSLLINNIL